MKIIPFTIAAIGFLFGAMSAAQADGQTTASATAPAATEPTTAPAKSDLQVVVDVSPKQKEYHVGDTIGISVTLKNVGKHKMTVFKPEGAQYDPNQDLAVGFSFQVATPKKLKDTGGMLGLVSAAHMGTFANGADSAASFIPLKPGESTAPVKYSTTLVLTGEMAVIGDYYNTSVDGREYYDEKDVAAAATKPAIESNIPKIKIDKIPDLYHGFMHGKYTIIISDDPPPEMKARFDAARQQIDDAGVPLADKTALLGKIAGENNVLAGRFILDIWRTTKQPAVKMIALKQWLDMLADGGYSYEGFPDAVKLLADDNTPTEIRAEIMDIISHLFIGAAGPAIVFRVDDQAQYATTPALGKATQAAVQAAFNTGEPSLVEKAKVILDQMKPPK